MTVYLSNRNTYLWKTLSSQACCLRVGDKRVGMVSNIHTLLFQINMLIFQYFSCISLHILSLHVFPTASMKDLHTGFYRIASHRWKTLRASWTVWKFTRKVVLGSLVALGIYRSTGTQGGMRRCAGLSVFDAGVIIIVDRLRLALSVYSNNSNGYY